jgi:hypothetical protein
MRRALKEASGWALQITKLHEVQLLAASSPSTRGSIINHVCCTVCLPASNSELYALEMVRLCLESVPAALFARGRTSVYLRKRAIWAQSLRSSFHCLPLLLCSFLLTLGLTRALFSCFGQRRTRDRGFFHLKLVVDRLVNGRQLDASCAFRARFSCSALRRAAAHHASAAIGCGQRTRPKRVFDRCTHLCTHMSSALCTAV